MNSAVPQPKRSQALRLPLVLLVLALVAAGAFLLLRPSAGGDAQAQGNLAGSAVGGPFTLVDETGRTVTSDSFAGKWRLMYFGFTYCPDICPTDAAKLAAGLKLFEAKHPEAAAQLQPMFLTVDPERDTPAVVAEFTDSFHPRLLGLTGSREQVDAALKAFRVYAAKVEGATPGSYTYDHLAVFYLMDPEGRPVQFIAGPTASPEAIASMLERFLA
jgi:protein SCO1/2